MLRAYAATVTSWLLKAAMQGAIARLPGRHRLNYLLQNHVTGSVALTEAGFERKLAQCRRHLASYVEHRGRLPGAALELGTGWYPVVPVGLILAGVDEVTTVDVSPLCDLARVHTTLEFFALQLHSEHLQPLLPEVRSDRAELVIAASEDLATHDARQLLARLGIRMLLCDVRRCGLPPGCVDLFVSNNTLEHIPLADLATIMAELRRLATPAAVMDHFVDMSDHYAHFDGSITEFNYLRYSDRVWRIVNNRLQYQNRLRVSDYRQIIEEAGFEVIAEEAERGSAHELDHIELAPSFRRYSSEELRVLRCWLTAAVRDSASAQRYAP